MSEGFMKKIKGIIFEPGSEDDYVDDYEYENEGNELPQQEEEPKLESTTTQVTKGSKVLNFHSNSQMKVVIVEPKKYDDVTIIADHLKQRRAVIMNLESVEHDSELKKSIYFFASGAVYILDGSMQKVSKSIFILAPNNVDIDANIKKELESKAFFPWQK